MKEAILLIIAGILAVIYNIMAEKIFAEESETIVEIKN